MAPQNHSLQLITICVCVCNINIFKLVPSLYIKVVHLLATCEHKLNDVCNRPQRTIHRVQKKMIRLLNWIVLHFSTCHSSQVNSIVCKSVYIPKPLYLCKLHGLGLVILVLVYKLHACVCQMC